MRAELELHDRVAWVAGGSAGIGSSVVERLENLGAVVGVLDVREPLRALPWAQCDVSHVQSVADSVDALSREIGPADILVYSAGVTADEPITGHTDDGWNRVLGVNLSGAFHLIRACLPPMLDAGWGRIITISSAGSVRVLPSRAAYASSKAGLNALTKVAALEGASYGVTANVVAPGLTNTAMASSVYGELKGTAEAVERTAASNPMGVLMEPSDIAHTVSFLASPQSRHITGQVIHVSAGSVI